MLLAAKQGLVDKVKEAINNKAKINAKDSDVSYTILW